MDPDHPAHSQTATRVRPPVLRVCVHRLARCLGMLLLVAGCEKTPEPSAVTALRAGTAPVWQTHDWPMTRGGPSLQGRVHDRVPKDPLVEWTFTAKDPVTSEAAVSNGLLVFGNDAGTVFAIDLKTRKERWRVLTKDTVEATPAITAGRVFVGSNDGWFRSIDAQTGRITWQIQGEEKFPTGGVLVTNPNDKRHDWILVNGYDGVSRALLAADGVEQWKYEAHNYINGSPAVLDGGQVTFGGCDSLIHVVRLKDGTRVSQLTTDAQIIRSLASCEHSLYGVNYANQLVAAEVPSNRVTWIYQDNDAQFLSSPAVDETRVYVGSRDKHLHAVDRLTGKQLWKFKTGGRVECSPLAFDDAVVFGSADGRLYAVDKQDGHEIWRLDLGENLAVAPAFADGRLFIGGGDGIMFVIRGGDGP